LITFKKEESRISFAVVESTIKDHQSIIYRNKASDLLMNKEDIECVNFNNFSCLIFTGTCLASEPSRSAVFYAIEKAKNSNIPIILDIDYRPYTWTSPKEASEVYMSASKSCDILIGNDDEFGVLANNFEKGMKIAKELSAEVSIVIYKKGEKGSVTFCDNKQINKGIFPVKALKPTGAGDAFMGSFIGGLLNNKNIEESIEYGSASAAIVVTKVGCAPAMPLLNEIEEFMKLNKISN
jgi:5-dehydro-2-deoxygluconokinase